MLWNFENGNWLTMTLATSRTSYNVSMSGDISERPILSFVIRFLPELRNFWKEKYENFNVFAFSFSKVYQKIRKLFYYSMQRPDLSLQNKIRYIKTEKLAQTLIYGGPPFVPNIEDFFLFFEPFQIRTLLLLKPHLLFSTWRCVKFNERKTNKVT